MIMIDIKNITKSFGSLQVLKGIDLHIDKGEVVSIVGPSGAGKTTLLQIIGTLDRPDVRQIFAQCPDESGVGLAVANRLKRAAAFRVVNARKLGISFICIYLGLDRTAEELGIKDYSVFIAHRQSSRGQADADMGMYVVNCLNVAVPEATPSLPFFKSGNTAS